MGLLDAARLSSLDPERAKEQAQKQMDAMLVRQMLHSSGAFKGSALAGSSLHADLFIDALADAVAKSADLGVGAAALGNVAVPAAAHAPAASIALPQPETADGLAAPLAQLRVTSDFGARLDPIDGHAASHSGVDLGAAAGTPILAAAPGTVIKAGARGGYGQAVEVDHGDGTTTLYAHASALLVKPGDTVAKGQAIGLVGATGRATGNHLHFEVRHSGRAVDPHAALKAYARRAEEGIEGIPQE